MGWIDKLKDYAPDIAMAVLSGGATLPKLAMKAIGDATGVNITSIEQAEIAIDAANPNQLLEIQQANQSFKLRMAELSNELTVTELGDVQDARNQHKHSIVPAVLVFMLTAMVAVGMYMLFVVEMPAANRDIGNMAFGQIFMAWLGALTFWNGTTRSSANKSIDAAMRR